MGRGEHTCIHADMHTCGGVRVILLPPVRQTMGLGNKKVCQGHLLTFELAQDTDLKEEVGD